MNGVNQANHALSAKRQRRSLARVLVGSVLVLMIGIACMITLSQTHEMNRLYAEREALLSERDRLKMKVDDLSRLEALSHTNRYWERIARSELGYLHPNEIMIRID